MSKKKVLLRGVFINRDTNGEGVLKVGTTLIRVSTVMGILYGIGVNPDLCNKHYGQRMLSITYEISKKLYPNKPLYLEVRTWNIRAVKCYQKAGFRIDGQAYELTTGIGTGTFYRMIRE